MPESKQPDKRRKARPSEVDISNSALFLRIVQLERQVKFLQRQIDLMQPHVEYAYGQTMSVGGGGSHR